MEECGPLGLDLIGWLSETSPLIPIRVQRQAAGLIGALGLLLPFLPLSRHLRTSSLKLLRSFVLNVLSVQLLTVDLLGGGTLISTSEIASLGSSRLFLFDLRELCVFLCCHKI